MRRKDKDDGREERLAVVGRGKQIEQVNRVCVRVRVCLSAVVVMKDSLSDMKSKPDAAGE